MSSTPLKALHWDVIDQLQRDGDWMSSRTLYERLRPTYGYSAATAKTMQRALQHLYQAGIIDSRGQGSGRSWVCIPGRVPARTKVDSVELAVALLQLEQFAENQLPAGALKTLRALRSQPRPVGQPPLVSTLPAGPCLARQGGGH